MPVASSWVGPASLCAALVLAATTCAAAPAARLVVQSGHAQHPMLALAPGGDFLASMDAESVKVWEAGGRLICQTRPPGAPASVSWAAEGRRLLLQGGGRVLAWDFTRCGEPAVAAAEALPALDGPVLQLMTLAGDRALALTARSLYTLKGVGSAAQVDQQRPLAGGSGERPAPPALRTPDGRRLTPQEFREQLEQRQQAARPGVPPPGAVIATSQDGSTVLLGPASMRLSAAVPTAVAESGAPFVLLRGSESLPLGRWLAGDRLAGGVHVAALSPSGRWLALGGPDRGGARVVVLDTQSGAITAQARLASNPPMPAWMRLMPRIGPFDPAEAYVAQQTLTGLAFSADEGRVLLLRGRVASTGDDADPALEERARADLAPLSQLPLRSAADARTGASAIGMAASPDGRQFAVVTYHQVDGYRFGRARFESRLDAGALVRWSASDLGVLDLAFARDGQLMVLRRQAGLAGRAGDSGTTRRVLAWSLGEGQARVLHDEPQWVDSSRSALSEDGRLLARVIENEENADAEAIGLRDVAAGRELWRQALPRDAGNAQVDGLAFSADGSRLAAVVQVKAALEQAAADAKSSLGDRLARLEEQRQRLQEQAAVPPEQRPRRSEIRAEMRRQRDEARSAAETRRTARQLWVLDGRNGEVRARIDLPPDLPLHPRLRFAGNDGVWVGPNFRADLAASADRPAAPVIGVAPGGARVVTAGTAATRGPKAIALPVAASATAWVSPGESRVAVFEPGRDLMLFDAADPAAPPRTLLRGADVTAVAFSYDENLLAAGLGEGEVALFDTRSARLVARLFSFADGQWAVVDEDSRFDTSSLEDGVPLHWVMADEPLRAYPLELLMRDYYEPRLLPKRLAGQALPARRPVAELVRAQPQVAIEKVELAPGRNDLADVTLSVSGTRDFRNRPSGAHDLRLFRDGQLVAWLPQQEGPLPAAGPDGRLRQVFRGVRLPAAGSAVEFSAYAFNSDRVKSATTRATLPARPARTAQRRAYVIAMGVSLHENPAWNLDFTVNDARAMLETLTAKLQATRQFGEVVGVPLVAAAGGAPANASKAALKAVLDLLAGRAADAAALKAVPEAARLRAVAPDDLVVISFAGHGFTWKGSGDFYLLPQDTGPGNGKEVGEALAAHAVSSAELAAWMREIDARDLVLLLDACHSAAAVENAEFRPGPMGARGLGQLAYDKGMRILAASQADDVALEMGSLQHGLLTYALVVEGLRHGRADWRPADRRIDIGEWLGWGATRVPALEAEMQGGSVAAPSRGAAAPSTQRAAVRMARRAATQKPALFDFLRRPQPQVIAGVD